MTRTRSSANRRAHRRLDLCTLLPCLAYLARHSGVRSPELLEMLQSRGLPVSRATLSRTLTDAEAHLGVQVRFRRDGGRGELYVEAWGIIDARKLLERYPEP